MGEHGAGAETRPLCTERSSLVTGLAWVSIVACSLMVVALGLELVTLFWLVHSDAITPEILGPGMPGGLVFVVRYLREISLALMLVTGVALWASIDLLRRRNWARWFFVIALAVGAVGNLLGVFLVPEFVPSPQAFFGDGLAPHLLAEVERMTRNMIWVSIGSGLLFVVLHAWVIWKLVTSPIGDEFA